MGVEAGPSDRVRQPGGVRPSSVLAELPHRLRCSAHASLAPWWKAAAKERAAQPHLTAEFVGACVRLSMSPRTRAWASTPSGADVEQRMTQRNGRPRGTFGPIAQAMLLAANEPGTVTELARRAQVGMSAARMTASRLLHRGDLVNCAPSGLRPAVLKRRDGVSIEPVGVDLLAASMRAWCAPAERRASKGDHDGG